LADILILDSEALNAVAHAAEGGSRGRRAAAVLRFVHQSHFHVRIPAAILVEICRGGGQDAALNLVIPKLGVVVPTTDGIARQAGQLLHERGLNSSHAIDAIVVATAIKAGGAFILTHDIDDIAALAAGHPNVVPYAV